MLLYDYGLCSDKSRDQNAERLYSDLDPVSPSPNIIELYSFWLVESGLDCTERAVESWSYTTGNENMSQKVFFKGVDLDIIYIYTISSIK